MHAEWRQKMWPSSVALCAYILYRSEVVLYQSQSYRLSSKLRACVCVFVRARQCVYSCSVRAWVFTIKSNVNKRKDGDYCACVLMLIMLCISTGSPIRGLDGLWTWLKKQQLNEWFIMITTMDRDGLNYYCLYLVTIWCSICLSVCLHACLSICICVPVSLSACLSVCFPYVSLSLSLSLVFSIYNGYLFFSVYAFLFRWLISRRLSLSLSFSLSVSPRLTPSLFLSVPSFIISYLRVLSVSSVYLTDWQSVSRLMSLAVCFWLSSRRHAFL